MDQTRSAPRTAVDITLALSVTSMTGH